MRRARWTIPARTDLAKIDDDLRSFDPGHAQRVGGEALKAARFLAQTPSAGVQLHGRFERKWRVQRTPYLLLYRVLPGEVQILRVLHSQSNWGGSP